jgi:hypothetical protein
VAAPLIRLRRLEWFVAQPIGAVVRILQGAAGS